MTEKIILIRHVDADGGEDIFRGQIDVDLTPKGLTHAKKLAEKLKTVHMDKIYSSTLKRALKTAEPIAKLHKLKIIKSDKIKEINFGIFDGLTRKEVLEKYPDIYEARGKDMINYRIPKGESYADVRKRALKFILSEAKKNPGKTLVFVTHGSLMRSILIGMTDKEIDKLKPVIGYGCRIFLEHNNGKLHLVKIEN